MTLQSWGFLKKTTGQTLKQPVVFLLKLLLLQSFWTAVTTTTHWIFLIVSCNLLLQKNWEMMKSWKQTEIFPTEELDVEQQMLNSTCFLW